MAAAQFPLERRALNGVDPILYCPSIDRVAALAIADDVRHDARAYSGCF